MPDGLVPRPPCRNSFATLGLVDALDGWFHVTTAPFWYSVASGG